jgi:hypothetical protein
MNENDISKSGRSGAVRSTWYPRLLPSMPRTPSRRNRIADCLMAIFILFARFLFIVGGVIGSLWPTAADVALGIIIGGGVGFWVRRSVGLRGGDLTHGFFVRMRERGVGSSPGLLESIVERIRGGVLTAYQCRLLASAYAEFQRGMQSCGSITERDDLYKIFDRSVQAAFRGDLATAKPKSDAAVPNK